MSKNVSDQIIQFLTALKTKFIYGIPGDTIDSLMESLRKQDAIKFIVMRHEETAAFAASAEAKLTGELAVCVACQGPGAVHLLNGLYDAALDHAPVLAITGQVDSSLIGSGMPQEINQLSLFSDVCVYNQELRSAAELIPTLISACQAAIAKQGVAHISIPSDLMRLPAVDHHPVNYSLFKSHTIQQACEEDLQAAAKELNQAEKVAILFGNGARHAADAVLTLAEKLQAPLIHTTRSKDIIDNHHPYFIGGIGLMGSYAANHAVQHCDVLMVVGSSFAFQDYYPEHAKIIQIDIDLTKISKHTHVNYSLVGDANTTINALLNMLIPKENQQFLHASQQIKKTNDKFENWQARASKKGEPIHPQAVTEKLSEFIEKDAIICADAGETTVWVNNFLKLTGQQKYTWSANLASLGSCLPATIGAQLAFPERQVIGLAGDGGFNMLIGDFATAVKYRLPIIYVVYNNAEYGFIELEEQGEGNPAFGTKLCNPDFVALAKAYGGDGIKVTNFDELDAALEKAKQATVPFVIDVYTNPKEMLIPPVINAKMMLGYAKSQIKGWFAKPSKADQI